MERVEANLAWLCTLIHSLKQTIFIVTNQFLVEGVLLQSRLTFKICLGDIKIKESIKTLILPPAVIFSDLDVIDTCFYFFETEGLATFSPLANIPFCFTATKHLFHPVEFATSVLDHKNVPYAKTNFFI